MSALAVSGEGHVELSSDAQTAQDAPAEVVAETAPLSAARTVLYSSGNLGAGFFYSLNNFILPFFLKNLGAPTILIGILSSSYSIEGSIIQPLVGAWSDRTWVRGLGRRRPFILAFLPLCVLFIALTPFIPGVGAQLGASKTTILVLAALAIFLFTLTFSVLYDPYLTLLPDITPPKQRGSVNGVFQLFGALGQMLLLLIGALLNVDLPILFLITAATFALFFIPSILGVREPRALPGAEMRHRYTLRQYWRELRSDPQVLLYYATQLFLGFGINAITPYLTLFATQEAHLDDTGALIISFILLLSTTVAVWPLGILADKRGLKPVFVLGMVCMAGASLAAIVVRDPIALGVIMAVAGVGNGAQFAASYPLLTRIVFPDRMGLYTGLNGSVNAITAPLAVLIAGGLITALGFKALFPFVAAMFLLALIPLAVLRIEKSHYQRSMREGTLAGESA